MPKKLDKTIKNAIYYRQYMAFLMRQDIKEKWIAALRSGEYKQCFGQLREDDCFCVIGVLCDIVFKENVLDISWKSVGGIYYIDNEDVLLSMKISYHVGLFSRIPATIDGISLTHLNDIKKLTFDELADIIENEVL